MVLCQAWPQRSVLCPHSSLSRQFPLLSLGSPRELEVGSLLEMNILLYMIQQSSTVHIILKQ